MKQIPGQLSFFDQLPKEEQKTCADCTHFHEVVSGLGDIYHDTACLKDSPWAKFKNPEDPACKDYIRREETDT